MIVTIFFLSLPDAAGCCRKSKTVTPESSSEQACFRVSQSNKLDADPEEFGQNDKIHESATPCSGRESRGFGEMKQS